MKTLNAPLQDSWCLMDRPKVVDFGGWVLRQIRPTEVTPSDLSREAGIPYPSLDRILKSGEKGHPVRPDASTVDKITQALVRLGVIDEVGEAWIAAGFLIDGYKVVHESSSSYQSNEITYELDPDTLALAEGYNGLPDMARRIVDSAYKSAAELALAMDREGVKGKRAED